jgi:hypothetical protein
LKILWLILYAFISPICATYATHLTLLSDDVDR